MVRLFVCIFFLITGLQVLAQSASERIHETANQISVDKYLFDTNSDFLKLGSHFSKEAVQEIHYTDRRIIKIDLVYTTYRESPDFSQKQLNLARLQNLIRINPEIVNNKFFAWNLIEQTGCNSSAECTDFFHGFVIYYDKYYTKKETIAEVDSIKKDLSELETTITQNNQLLELHTEEIECEHPDMLYSTEYLSEQLEKFYSCGEKFSGRVFFSAKVDYKGRVEGVDVKGSLFPCKDKLASVLKHILQWKRGLIIGRQQFGVTANGYVSFPIRKESVAITSFTISKELVDTYKIFEQTTNCLAYETDTAFVKLLPRITKKEVSTVLYRNKWDDKLIIVDVTGSMFPYTADLLKWIRLGAIEGEKTYVFFNDGDDKPTNQKRIGSTGGLYLVRSDKFEEVRDTMFEAMRKGGGGDLSENNIEALLHGISRSGYPNSAIMIADNLSFPRDHQLLVNYKGFLKIILCGTEKGINTDYLDLAKKYGFTLHTLKTDITQLKTINPGKRMTIDGFEYRYNPGGFERMY